jgi:hypothetical protein
MIRGPAEEVVWHHGDDSRWYWSSSFIVILFSSASVNLIFRLSDDVLIVGVVAIAQSVARHFEILALSAVSLPVVISLPQWFANK